MKSYSAQKKTMGGVGLISPHMMIILLIISLGKIVYYGIKLSSNYIREKRKKKTIDKEKIKLKLLSKVLEKIQREL